jgi:hypothetical protein
MQVVVASVKDMAMVMELVKNQLVRFVRR